jgi:nicotinamide-nucleotide amidase
MRVTSEGVLIDQIAHAVQERQWQVAVAESLTCGRILSTLGAGPDAATWLAGGVVAYRPGIKFRLLDVNPGPVITPACARQMATGVAALMRADVAVGVTGCGGPDPEEGQPPGTVFIAAAAGDLVVEGALEIEGTPDVVLEATTHHALHLLHELVTN